MDWRSGAAAGIGLFAKRVFQVMYVCVGNDRLTGQDDLFLLQGEQPGKGGIDLVDHNGMTITEMAEMFFKRTHDFAQRVPSHFFTNYFAQLDRENEKTLCFPEIGTDGQSVVGRNCYFHVREVLKNTGANMFQVAQR